MAAHPQIDLQVAYCSLRGAHSGYDPEFATAIQWDVPLLDGCNWVETPNIGTDTESFLGLCNPGLWRLISLDYSRFYWQKKKRYSKRMMNTGF
jgi:hypothetical protein